MRNVLIIGIGNTLRSDDGIGIVAAQKLEKAALEPHVRIIDCQQLTPDLAKDISEADRVIMIDSDQENRPGKVTVKKIVLENRAVDSFTHNLEPGTLLTYARDLYGSTADAFLVTTAGESFEFGEGVSQVATGAIPEILRLVTDLASFNKP